LAGDARELAQKFHAPLPYVFVQRFVQIVEVKERRGGAEFLALEKHRRPRSEQQQRSHRAEPARRSLLPGAQSEAGVGDLVVIFDEADKRRRLDVEGWRATAFLLPLIPLALIEIAVFSR